MDFSYPFGYIMRMYTVRRTAEFDAWFASVEDMMVRVRLARRLERKRNQARDIRRAKALSARLQE